MLSRDREIFDGAVQLPPEEWRAFVVTQAAGDEALVERVMRLLDAHQRAEDFPDFVNLTLRDDSIGHLKVGDAIGRYHIREKIGEGGFGEVYLAEQREPVKRQVAIKILKAGMDTKEVLNRFKAEQQALALMNHPNIARVLDADSTESGHPYFVMELVRGEPITTYCDRQELTIAERLALFIPVCDAVQHAHQQGIIHRDIKPSNILVSAIDGDATARVIDFGIAKAMRGSLTEETLYTHIGAFMGTPEFMSPEQAEGSADVDKRTDIYSLGVVLYNLLCGALPFEPASLRNKPFYEIQRILREVEPPRPSVRFSTTDKRPAGPRGRFRADAKTVVGALKGDLDWIVLKAMEKDRTRRYDSAAELGRDIARYLKDEPVTAGPPTVRYRFGKFIRKNRRVVAFVTVVAAAIVVIVGRTDRTPPPNPHDTTPLETSAHTRPAPDPKSIAVLAFANMSPDEGQEYFSDGIAEEVLNLLARIPELKVISRTSAFSFKGKDVTLSQVADELNVAHILEGSVRRSGDQVRVTAQLIEASSDTHLWSETYDRTLDDIFAIQGDIASDVVAQLKITLLGEAPKVKEPDPEAFALYLQARYVTRLSTTDAFEESMALLNQALAIDSSYAAAWASLASNYINLANHGVLPEDAAYGHAREMAQKAITIDPDFAQAHAELGWIASVYGKDLATAARHYERALALDHSDLNVIGGAAQLLSELGRLDEAIVLLEYVRERDLINPVRHHNLGVSYKLDHRWDKAIAAHRTALRLSPGYIGAHYGIGVALLMKGEAQLAVEEFALEGDEEWRVKGTALALHDLGRKQDYEAALADLIARWGEQWPTEVAHVYGWTGDADSAFLWLEKEIEKRGAFDGLEAMLPFYMPINTDPRWATLLERADASPARLDSIRFNVTLPQ